MLAGNRYLPAGIAGRLFRGAREDRILLLGSAIRVNGLRSWLENKRLIGLRTIGVLSDDPLAAAIGDYRLLGGTAELERVIREHHITQVLLVELPAHSKALRRYIHICEKAAVRLLTVSDLEERFRHSVRLFEDDGRRFIALRDEPLEDPLNRAAKRTLDVAVSLPVVALLLPPLTLMVWALQRLQSPGPVFFVQPRVGMQNRAFKIIKFRTMHAGHQDEARQATVDDRRIFARAAGSEGSASMNSPSF